MRMSIIYGYGIKADTITVVPAGLDACLKRAPNTLEYVKEFLSATGLPFSDYEALDRGEIANFLTSDLISTLKDRFEEYQSESGAEMGLPQLICDIITEISGLPFDVYSDYDGFPYIIVQPMYPWEIRYSAPCKLEQVEETLKSILRTLSQNPEAEIKIDYQSVVNFD